jgi:hypothetical protein
LKPEGRSRFEVNNEAEPRPQPDDLIPRLQDTGQTM